MSIDLSKFCAEEGRRYHLGNPFSRAGYTWATDGKILLRVPLRADVPDVEGAPHTERVWSDAKGAFVPVQAFKVPDPERMQCDVCEGRGTMHDCPDCTCECDECEGTGQIEEATFVSIGDGPTMQRKYALKIMALPGLEVEVPELTVERMHFRFEGGEGIVMLMRPGYRRAIVADLLKGCAESV
jgi:hypothetical protein